MTTTLSQEGQVTVPKHIRDSLRLKPGSKLAFEGNAQGDIVLRQAGGVEA